MGKKTKQTSIKNHLIVWCAYFVTILAAAYVGKLLYNDLNIVIRSQLQQPRRVAVRVLGCEDNLRQPDNCMVQLVDSPNTIKRLEVEKTKNYQVDQQMYVFAYGETLGIDSRAVAPRTRLIVVSGVFIPLGTVAVGAKVYKKVIKKSAKRRR